MKLFFVALGYTAISLFWLLKPAVDTSQRAYYHWHGDPAGLALATAVDAAIFCLALALALFACRHPGRARVALWTGLVLFLPWITFQDACALYGFVPARRYSLLLFGGALLSTAFVAAFWRPAFAASFEKTVDAANTILIFAGIFGCFLFGRLTVFGYQARRQAAKSPLHRAQSKTIRQPHRIIWIVFDELSYQQLYEHRFPGLQLPAFDALAAQSTSFTQAIPPSLYTQIILPGLLSGKPVDDIRASVGDQLWISQSGRWSRFDQHDTLFQDALNAGYSTSVAGWYNPYCRILHQVLDQCSWVFRDTISNNMVSSASVLSNIVNPLSKLEYMFLTPLPAAIQQDIEQRSKRLGVSMEVPELHIQDYRDLYAGSIRLLRDPSAGFVFLHLPVPHPYGIYDRRTGNLTTTAVTSSSYIDNLALADKCLAGLRQTLEQSGQWDSSTVVVMGDHGWRAQIWKPARQFMPEEDVASRGGKYDERPAYLVKLPSQTAPAHIDTPFPTVNTRKLLDAVLSGNIETPADLAAWSDTVH